ncbi:MAG: hypothetical protein AAGA30_10365 [Planctomycetota bacterium]
MLFSKTTLLLFIYLVPTTPHVATNELPELFENYWARLVVRKTTSFKWETLTSKQSDRYLGLVEGSLGVNLPSHWENCFSRMYVRKNKTTGRLNLKFPTVDFAPWTGHVEPTEVEKQIEKFEATLSDAGTITISRVHGENGSEFGEGFVVPENFSAELVDATNGLVRITAVIFVNQKVYFAANVDDETPSGSIYCFEKKRQKLVWKSKINDYGGPDFRGSSTWFSQICKSENGILIFSICDTGFAIDRIDENGVSTRIFGFSNR